METGASYNTDVPVAVIGGTGALPAALVRSLSASGRAARLCEMQGFPLEGLDGHPKHSFRLETLAELLAGLHDADVREVCFAGAIRRPVIDGTLVTAASAPLVARLGDAMRLGDDGVLRSVIAIFEAAGLRVVGASDIAPDLLPPAGLLTDALLYDGSGADLTAARAAHLRLAAQDAGQAVVARAGRVIAGEGADGTDAMLAGLADALSLSRPDSLTGSPATGLLFKAPKPDQDRRVDLPVIGPRTVRCVAAARLAAIVIDAGGVMVLDRVQTVALANQLGICIDVRPAPATIAAHPAVSGPLE